MSEVAGPGGSAVPRCRSCTTLRRLQPIPLDRAGAVAPLLLLALTVWPLDVIVKQLLQALV